MEEPNNLMMHEQGLTPEEQLPDGREWQDDEFAGHDETGGAPCEGNGGRLLTESPSTFESTMEMERRCSGSYAESQARLARTLLMLVELAERRGPYGAD